MKIRHRPKKPPKKCGTTELRVDESRKSRPPAEVEDQRMVNPPDPFDTNPWGQ